MMPEPSQLVHADCQNCEQTIRAARTPRVDRAWAHVDTGFPECRRNLPRGFTNNARPREGTVTE